MLSLPIHLRLFITQQLGKNNFFWTPCITRGNTVQNLIYVQQYSVQLWWYTVLCCVLTIPLKHQYIRTPLIEMHTEFHRYFDFLFWLSDFKVVSLCGGYNSWEGKVACSIIHFLISYINVNNNIYHNVGHNIFKSLLEVSARYVTRTKVKLNKKHSVSGKNILN